MASARNASGSVAPSPASAVVTSIRRVTRGRIDDDADGFAAGKRQAAAYFLRRELPVVDAKFDLLAAGDRTTLDMRDDWF